MTVALALLHASSTAAREGGDDDADDFDNELFPVDFHCDQGEGVNRGAFLTVGKGTKKFRNGARVEK